MKHVRFRVEGDYWIPTYFGGVKPGEILDLERSYLRTEIRGILSQGANFEVTLKEEEEPDGR